MISFKTSRKLGVFVLEWFFNIERGLLGMAKELRWLEKSSGWLRGMVMLKEGELYSFDAKVLDNPSRVGLYGTEIIKLIVWYGIDFSTKKVIVNYDEGWDISVSSSEESDVLKKVLDVLRDRETLLS